MGKMHLKNERGNWPQSPHIFCSSGRSEEEKLTKIERKITNKSQNMLSKTFEVELIFT